MSNILSFFVSHSVSGYAGPYFPGNEVCAFLLIADMGCACIITCSCYCLLTQAQVISNTGNQENGIHLMDIHFLGNLTLSVSCNLANLHSSHQHVFTEHQGLLRDGRAI